VNRQAHQPFQACPAYREFSLELYEDFVAGFLKSADLAQNSWDRSGKIFCWFLFGAVIALETAEARSAD
jgi:hypothetical protein